MTLRSLEEKLRYLGDDELREWLAEELEYIYGELRCLEDMILQLLIDIERLGEETSVLRCELSAQHEELSWLDFKLRRR